MTAPTPQRPAMADYGVPEDLDGVLPWSWAEERLVRSRNYWVVTASADGRPAATPVWGHWEADPGRFVFGCAPSSRKFRNIAANPNVVVAADDTVEVVSVDGTAAAVEPGEVAAALDAMAAKYHEDEAARAEFRGFLDQHPVVVVSPTRAYGIIETEEDFARRATRWVW